jgi:hypothetical protein
MDERVRTVAVERVEHHLSPATLTALENHLETL